MKIAILIILVILPFPSFAQTVNLDCEVTIENAYGDHFSVGDKYAFEIDLDLDRRSASVPKWTSQQFVENANDPDYELSIATDYVRIGSMENGFGHGILNREDLSMIYILDGILGIYRGGGSCELVERPKKKMAF